MNKQTQTTAAKRTVWTRAEWLKVVAHIHMNNPQLHLEHDSALARVRCIKPAMLEAAQKIVIDHWRQRKSFQISTIVPALEQGLRDLHESIAADVQEEAQPEVETTAVEVTPAIEDIGPDTEVDPYQQAFSPLIQLVANEVVKQLSPRLNKLEEMLQALLNAERITLAQHEEKERPATIVQPERRNMQTRKPRIGVVGVLPIQAEAIAKAFPNVAFTFIEKGPSGVLEKVQSCDRTIGMTKFMAHSTDGVLRKGLGSRYVRTAGGPSEIKRMIEMWLHAQTIPSGTAA